YPQHARAPERCLEHVVASGKSSRMRTGRPGGGVCSTHLEHDDRLGERDFSSGREKRARIADRLHVAEDAPGVRVVTEVSDEITPSHIKHRADRNKPAEADVFAETP